MAEQRVVIAVACVAGVGVMSPLARAGGTNVAAAANEIVVTATRTAAKIADVPASVEVIDRRAIETAGAANVDQLCKTLVGVDLQGSAVAGSAVRLNMRGLTPGYQSERVLVLVDGRRVNDPYVGNMEFALLPADNIERIEVLKGPASALYGSNAMGGVVNIVTRKGAVVPVTELKAETGSHGTQVFRLGHGWKKGRLDYFLTGSHVATDGYMRNSDGTRRDWTADNLTGNFGWELSADSDLRVLLGGYAAEGTDENSRREVNKDYESAAYRLKWHTRRDAQLQARVYRNGEHQVYDWKYPGEGIYRLETLGAELQQSLWVTDTQLLTAGGDARRDRADIDEVAQRIDESASALGAYLQDEVHFGDALRATVGLRADYESSYGTEPCPRVGLLWKLSDQVEAYGTWNRAFRAPSLSDRFVKVEFNGMQFVGNPDLQPETLTAYEVGLRGRLGDALRTAVAAFYNDIEDSFDFMFDPDGVFRNRNVTRSRSAGVECSVEWQITERLSSFANYSYTDGTYEEFPANPSVEGNRLAYLARDKAAAGLGYTTASGSSHTAGCRYAGPRYGDAQNTPESRMGDYVTVDWRSRVAVAPGVFMTLSIDNVMDRHYREFPTFDQPGRSFLVGAELKF